MKAGKKKAGRSLCSDPLSFSGSLDHAELARVVGGDILEEPESGLPRFTDKQGIDGNLFPVGEKDVGEGLFIGLLTVESTALGSVPQQDQSTAFGQDQ